MVVDGIPPAGLAPAPPRFEEDARARHQPPRPAPVRVVNRGTSAGPAVRSAERAPAEPDRRADPYGYAAGYGAYKGGAPSAPAYLIAPNARIITIETD